MTNQRQSVGRRGEDVAADFLRQQGCLVIDRNLRTPYGEMDIIARQGDEIIICEVKARSGNKYGYPETAVNKAKYENIVQSAQYYLTGRGLKDFWRVDIVSVEFSLNAEPKITWFKNVTMDQDGRNF